uniref:Uncharacterized protein n=1 Tax=Siphoviridae sp. ctquf9 TaxID=2826470 RepID=A0A8S5M473_9CAUD|nr:MAG TPA: hypothetical protein [Siphoviridae sp. ctquf9]
MKPFIAPCRDKAVKYTAFLTDICSVYIAQMT